MTDGRVVKEGLSAWHCNCRKLFGPYQLNPAELARCAICGVERHIDPTVTKSMNLAAVSPASVDDRVELQTFLA